MSCEGGRPEANKYFEFPGEKRGQKLQSSDVAGIAPPLCAVLVPRSRSWFYSEVPLPQQQLDLDPVRPEQQERECL